MILCFDLDDTLYEEIDYVKSGFRAISIYLYEMQVLNLSEREIYLQLYEILELEGRGKVIDKFLKNHNIFSKKLVKKCLSIYRNHLPKIELSKNVMETLKRLKKKVGKMYVVTDGNITVQRNKIKALNLKKYFYKTLPTYQYGVKFSKPSTYVFEKICNWENKKIDELIYVGDNPYKDFINLKKRGALTIRINQGIFKNLKLNDEYMAEREISSIEEILNLI